MGRMFDEHIVRKIQNLDGWWDFCIDPDDTGEEEKWYENLPKKEKTYVPSVWNTQKELIKYEGKVWYEKSFYSDGGNLRFCFGACLTEAKVWLDGVYLGYHYGGFSQFEFIASDVYSGYHKLTVCVDNHFDEHSIPQRKVDWYHYGGITRSVSVETLNGICVLANKLIYELSSDLKDVTGKFDIELYNSENTSCKTKLNIKTDEIDVFECEVELNAKETKIISSDIFNLKNVKLWDINLPNLYNVYITTDTDDLFDRVGFRKISVENKKVMLNNKEIELRGVNRHEEYPEFGFAFPKTLIKRDVDLILEMGCNSIRGSHYPNMREFVDYLDENGILFWSEIPIWGVGFSEEALMDEVIINRGFDMHKEMVKYYYNHPSIIMWGMHNEILTNVKAGYDISKKYYKYLKENGGNRLVVYASSHALTDICFEFTDVICLNEYQGWYGGSIDTWESFVDNFVEYRNKLGFENKPVIISEFGAAAIYGWHDSDKIWWSEEYQAELISHALSVFHSNENVTGSFIWQFSDMRTCKEAGMNRARGFNNKGMVNEHRRPKLAFHAAKQKYNEFKNE
ncbi:MAG: beta-glucuronidase [Ruminococcaceae bacterium]|nr:beta-glucuronidase [Oscillospiraceae bacterium]